MSLFKLTPSELKILRSLNTPIKIQDFLDTLPINFEKNGDSCLSPRRVLRERMAHCFDGAVFAALALRLHGRPPLIMNIRVTDDDDDHTVAIFKDFGCYGAISKTNHGTVRYRDPVYKTLRELTMSYFHEYTEPKGKKILRAHSRLIDLSRFDSQKWMTTEEDLSFIHDYMALSRHYPVITQGQIKALRPADAMERKIGAIVEWDPK